MPKRSVVETRRLIDVACGRRPADYYVANGRIVNVYSGEVIEGNVAISGKRIAYVGPSATMVGSKTKVVDAGGDYLMPGFFDPHRHADLLYMCDSLDHAYKPWKFDIFKENINISRGCPPFLG